VSDHSESSVILQAAGLAIVERTSAQSTPAPVVVLHAAVDGRPAIALWDTGAEGNFVSWSFIERHGLQSLLKPTRQLVKYADGTVHSARGKAALPITILTQGRPHDSCINAVVADLQPRFDVVLGTPFCRAHRPRPDWDTMTIALAVPCGDGESEWSPALRAAATCVKGSDVVGVQLGKTSSESEVEQHAFSTAQQQQHWHVSVGPASQDNPFAPHPSPCMAVALASSSQLALLLDHDDSEDIACPQPEHDRRLQTPVRNTTDEARAATDVPSAIQQLPGSVLPSQPPPPATAVSNRPRVGARRAMGEPTSPDCASCQEYVGAGVEHVCTRIVGGDSCPPAAPWTKSEGVDCTRSENEDTMPTMLPGLHATTKGQATAEQAC
jgi:hypothetical protein